MRVLVHSVPGTVPQLVGSVPSWCHSSPKKWEMGMFRVSQLCSVLGPGLTPAPSQHFPQSLGWEKPLGCSWSLPLPPTVFTSQRDPEQQNNHFQHHYPSQTPASNFNQRSWCCFKIRGF